MAFHPITGEAIARCRTCHGSVPAPDGCPECAPFRLAEVFEAYRDEHAGDHDGDYCPVCSGDCEDCDTKDDEIEELRTIAEHHRDLAIALCAVLEADGGRRIGARRALAAEYRARIDAAKLPPANPPIDVATIKAGRSDADVSIAGEG